jgi:hypothetical protein
LKTGTLEHEYDENGIHWILLCSKCLGELPDEAIAVAKTPRSGN